MKCIRQGDVMLRKTVIPADVQRIAVRPIALGERTGHSHNLVSNVVECPIENLVEMYEKDGQTFIRVLGDPGDISLVHQQHKTHPVEPGEYVYVPQVENSDWGTRPVVD